MYNEKTGFTHFDSDGACCGGNYRLRRLRKKETKAATTAAETETVEATEAAKEYVQGITTETGWESQWLNMKFTAGEGVTMMSEADMDEVMSAGEEVTGTETDGFEYTYEMMASDATGVTSVGVIVEKALVSPEQYMEVLVQELEGMEGEITFSVVNGIVDQEFLGRPMKFVEVDSSYQGVNMVQTYMIGEQDGYLIEIIGTGTAETREALEGLMNSFSTLE